MIPGYEALTLKPTPRCSSDDSSPTTTEEDDDELVSGIEEKCQAFETMVVLVSTLGGRCVAVFFFFLSLWSPTSRLGRYAPYLAQSLELVLPQLRFYFHDGVREACALYVFSLSLAYSPAHTLRYPSLIPLLLSTGLQSSTLTPPMLHASLHQLTSSINDEQDPSYLASLIKAFADCVLIISKHSAALGEGGGIEGYKEAVLEATKRQLSVVAERRRVRAARYGGEVGGREFWFLFRFGFWC